MELKAIYGAEIVAEEVECGQTIRDEVDQNLSIELVDRMRKLIGAQREEIVFRERLVHVLTRYQRFLAKAPQVMRMERRKQLSKLHDKAHSFLAAMETLHPEVRRSLETVLDAQSLNDRWQGFDVFNLEQPLPEDDDSLEHAQSAATKIIEACRVELGLLDESKGTKKGSANPALDQLLVDMASLYEAETNHPAASHCYRDETSKDEFGGKFFNMVKAILDECVPESYGTAVALGKRINRLFEEA